MPIFSYYSDEHEINDDEDNLFQIAPDNKEEKLLYNIKDKFNEEKRKELLSKTHSLNRIKE